MGAAAWESGQLRVIALVFPSTPLEELSTEWRWVRVDSGYDAAREMLAEPPAAVVVDLARIPAGHVGLLALSARLNVPVVAFGEISADLGPETLATARLVARDRLAEAVAETLRSQPPRQTETPEEDQPVQEQPPRDEPSEPPRPTETLTQAELDALLG